MRRIALFGVLLLVACAANPTPGEPGYAYNLLGAYQARFVVQGAPYTGTMQLATAEGGAVSGTFDLAGEASVTGTAAGTLTGDDVVMTLSYSVAEAGCGGTADVEGTVARGGKLVTGTISTDDGCAGRSTGSFTLTQE